MLVKQISVFVENTTGRLSKLTRTLAESGIDILAISIADTVDFGILRCIVNDPDKAVEVLKAGGFTASMTKVLAIELDDSPGGLATVLEYLSEEHIGVDYVYSFVHHREGRALILFKVGDAEKAVRVLTEKNVRLLCLADLFEGK